VVTKAASGLTEERLGRFEMRFGPDSAGPEEFPVVSSSLTLLWGVLHASSVLTVSGVGEAAGFAVLFESTQKPSPRTTMTFCEQTSEQGTVN
jgi:hypothetical protein